MMKFLAGPELTLKTVMGKALDLKSGEKNILGLAGKPEDSNLITRNFAPVKGNHIKSNKQRSPELQVWKKPYRKDASLRES